MSDKICSAAWYICDRCKHGKMDMNHETFLPNGEPSQVWCDLSMWAKKRGTTINCKHFIANNLQTTCKQNVGKP